MNIPRIPLDYDDLNAPRDWLNHEPPHCIELTEGQFWGGAIVLLMIGMVLGASFGVLVTP